MHLIFEESAHSNRKSSYRNNFKGIPPRLSVKEIMPCHSPTEAGHRPKMRADSIGGGSIITKGPIPVLRSRKLSEMTRSKMFIVTVNRSERCVGQMFYLMGKKKQIEIN